VSSVLEGKPLIEVSSGEALLKEEEGGGGVRGQREPPFASTFCPLHASK